MRSAPVPVLALAGLLVLSACSGSDGGSDPAAADPGVVVETGTHDELIEAGGAYAALVAAQAGTVPVG